MRARALTGAHCETCILGRLWGICVEGGPEGRRRGGRRARHCARSAPAPPLPIAEPDGRVRSRPSRRLHTSKFGSTTWWRWHRAASKSELCETSLRFSGPPLEIPPKIAFKWGGVRSKRSLCCGRAIGVSVERRGRIPPSNFGPSPVGSSQDCLKVGGSDLSALCSAVVRSASRGRRRTMQQNRLHVRMGHITITWPPLP